MHTWAFVSTWSTRSRTHLFYPYTKRAYNKWQDILHIQHSGETSQDMDHIVIYITKETPQYYMSDYWFFLGAGSFDVPLSHPGTSRNLFTMERESTKPGWGGCTISITSRAAPSRSWISLSILSLSWFNFWMVLKLSTSFISALLSSASMLFLYTSRSASACFSSSHYQRAWFLSSARQHHCEILRIWWLSQSIYQLLAILTLASSQFFILCYAGASSLQIR